MHAHIPCIELENNKVKIVKTPWEGLYPGFILLFEALVLNLVKHMPVHVVSRIIKENDYKNWEMMSRYTEEARKKEDFGNIEKV